MPAEKEVHEDLCVVQLEIAEYEDQLGIQPPTLYEFMQVDANLPIFSSSSSSSPNQQNTEEQIVAMLTRAARDRQSFKVASSQAAKDRNNGTAAFINDSDNQKQQQYSSSSSSFSWSSAIDQRHQQDILHVGTVMRALTNKTKREWYNDKFMRPLGFFGGMEGGPAAAGGGEGGGGGWFGLAGGAGSSSAVSRKDWLRSVCPGSRDGRLEDPDRRSGGI